MLEPNKSSRFMRRRLVRQKSGSRPAQPHQKRSPEGPPLLPPPDFPQDVTHIRQLGYSSQSAAVPLNPSQTRRRAPQRMGHTPSPAEDNNRFNLRHLLNDRQTGTSGRSQPRRRDNKTAPRSRAGSPQHSQISYPISPPHQGAGLQPYPGSNPSALRQPSRSKLTTFRKPTPADSGKVRVLNPYPVAVPAPTGLRRPQRRSRRKPSPLLYLTRLLILGVGIGAIAGTILSVWDPSSRERLDSQPTFGLPFGNDSDNASNSAASRDLTPGKITPLPVALNLNEPIAPLATTIQSLTAQYPGLSPGVFVVDLDTGAYLDLNGGAIFSAASTIKVPILVAFLQDVDAGKIRLDEMLVMQQADIAAGSGDMQYQPVGTQYNALETAAKMITISDNTATNMLITRLGGAEALNQRFRSWGLTNTVLRNPLADLEGTNITSPKDLTGLLTMVSQGDLLSLRSRDRLFEIMQGTVTNTLLPSGLDTGATIAHKTGTIDTMVGDTGIVDMPNGKRYIVTVIVQRPTEDDRAQELIRQISRAVYQQFNSVTTPQMGVATPSQVTVPGAEPAASPMAPNQYQYPNRVPAPNQPPNTPLPPGNSYLNQTAPLSPAQNNR